MKNKINLPNKVKTSFKSRVEGLSSNKKPTEIKETRSEHRILLEYILNEHLSLNRARFHPESFVPVINSFREKDLIIKLFEESDTEDLREIWIEKVTKLIQKGYNTLKEDNETGSDILLVAGRLIRCSILNLSHPLRLIFPKWSKELLSALHKSNISHSSYSEIIYALSELIYGTKDRCYLENSEANDIIPTFSKLLVSRLDSSSNIMKTSILSSLRMLVRLFPSQTRSISKSLFDTLQHFWLWTNPSEIQLTSSSFLYKYTFDCLVELSISQGNRENSNFPQEYYLKFEKVLDTAHKILNNIFKDAQKPYEGIDGAYHFIINPPDKLDLSRTNHKIQLEKFELACHYISAFLNYRPEHYPLVILEAPIQKLLDLAIRIYSMGPNLQNLNEGNPLDLLSFRSILPKLYDLANELIIESCYVFGVSFLEYSENVHKVIKRTLQSNSNDNVLKLKLYDLIYYMINLMEENILYHIINPLIPSILEDIREVFTKNKPIKYEKDLKIKGKESKTSNLIQLESDISKTFIVGPTYYPALNVLTEILKHESNKFTEDHFYYIINLIVEQTSLLVTGKLELSKKQHITLLKCLHMLALKPSQYQSLLIEHAIKILDIERNKCYEYYDQFSIFLKELKMLIHPQAPPKELSKVSFLLKTTRDNDKFNLNNYSNTKISSVIEEMAEDHNENDINVIDFEEDLEIEEPSEEEIQKDNIVKRLADDELKGPEAKKLNTYKGSPDEVIESISVIDEVATKDDKERETHEIIEPISITDEAGIKESDEKGASELSEPISVTNEMIVNKDNEKEIEVKLARALEDESSDEDEIPDIVS